MQADALVAALVLEDGRRWGDAAHPWQWADARAVLDRSGPRMHALTRPRGASKTTDLAAVAVVILAAQAPAASRSYWIAVDADQAGLGMDAIRGFVHRTPGLAAVLDLKSRQVINRSNGAALEILPADGASSWGLRPHLVVVDEWAQWPSTRNHRELWTALVSSIPKVHDARLIALTSSGDPTHWSFRVLQHARGSDRWRVAETPGPTPWWSPEQIDEQRSLLTESEFARLVLNEWTASEDKLTTVDAIDRCVARGAGTLDPVPGIRYVVSLDVGLTNDATVACVAHLDRDGAEATVVLDRIERWRGRKGSPVDLGTVEDAVEGLSATYNGARVVVDPYQAVHLAQGLRRRGVQVREFTFSQASTGRLGLLLYRLLRDARLDLPDDPDLIAELASVRLRENGPGSYRLDHERGQHDDQAVALALAAHELLEHRRTRRRSIVDPDAEHRHEVELLGDRSLIAHESVDVMAAVASILRGES
jgi:hypothetical protein